MSLKHERISCEGANLHIIGSMHAEQNMWSRNEKCREICSNIQNKLSNIKPNTIFIETTPDKVKNISSYENASPLSSSVELIAIAKYVKNNNINIVSVDSESLRDLYKGNDISEDMIDFTHLVRNNAIGYNTLINIRQNNIQGTCVLIIGRNHMGEVLEILS